MIRRTMRTIAEDETRHAELSRATAHFLSRHLDARMQRRVETAQHRAMATLYETASDPPAEIITQAGVPSKVNARRLLDEMARL